MYSLLTVKRLPGIFFCLALLVSACDTQGPDTNGQGQSPDNSGPSEPACTLTQEEIFSGGVGRDQIPALTDPLMISVDQATYLQDQDRIIGFHVGGQTYAIPHNILWYHEIVNLNLGSTRLAVTYCPFTGSSLVFDRRVINGNEFGVSGLLLQNNLILFDRSEEESLWPQMRRRAECGPKLGATLTMYPALDIRWGAWKSLYPETQVLSNETGFSLGYRSIDYPYGNYEEPDNDNLFINMEIDERWPPKERLLGIPDSRLGGTAFLFSVLDEAGEKRAIHTHTAAGSTVVFWDRESYTAMAFIPRLDSQTALRFTTENDRIIDEDTRSVWTIDGIAIEGPLAGSRLEPVEDSYVAFWFAWAAFHPETTIWTP